MDELEEVKFPTEFIWYTCKFCLEIFNEIDHVIDHQRLSHMDQIKHVMIRELVLKKAEDVNNESEGHVWKKDDNSARVSTTATTATMIEFTKSTTTGGQVIVGGQGNSSSNGCSSINSSPLLGKSPAMMSSMAELHDGHMSTSNKMSPFGLSLQQPPQPLQPNPFIPSFATAFSSPATTTTTMVADIFGGQQNPLVPPPPHYYHHNHHHHQQQPVVDYVAFNRCDQNVFHSNVNSHVSYCQQQQRKKQEFQRKFSDLKGASLRNRKQKWEAKKVTKPTQVINKAEPTIPRPPLTYACLSALALKNSTAGRLSTPAIYQFICDHFPYYKALPNSHWRNSLRHALTTSDSFKFCNHDSQSDDGQGQGQSSKHGFWTISPEAKEALQMEDKLRLAMTKNRVGILATMTQPANFPLLERGELKTDVTTTTTTTTQPGQL